VDEHQPTGTTSDAAPVAPSVTPEWVPARSGHALGAAAHAYAYMRILLGCSGLVAPAPVGRLFGIGDSPTAKLASRHIAARDLVTGVGMVLGRRHGAARGWYEAAAVTDLIDASIAVAAGVTGALPRRRAAQVVVLAGGSAVTGFVLARAVDQASSSTSSSTSSSSSVPT
jgi:hypothetical protein